MSYNPQPEVRIEAPEGFQIDKENSTFEVIKFKKIEAQLPKSWEDLETIEGYYTNSFSDIQYLGKQRIKNKSLNTFLNEKQSEASIALAQLSQLRDVYRNGWVPDYNNVKDYKYCIITCGTDKFNIQLFYELSFFLSFQSRKIAEQFLHNFKDLILKAKPLMS